MVWDRSGLQMGKILLPLWYYIALLPLTDLAFLFLDMLALTILYCGLFFYIRIQSRKLRNFATASGMGAQVKYQIPSWESNVEACHEPRVTSPLRMFSTKTVRVTTEDNPTNSPRPTSEPHRARRQINKASFTMLCYPLIYMLLTIPISLSRVSQFANKKGSLTSVYIGAGILELAGFVNVLLYTGTRKGIISWDSLFRKFGCQSSKMSTSPITLNCHGTRQTAAAVTTKQSGLSIPSLKSNFR